VAVTLALLEVLRHTQSSGVLFSPETTWLLTGYLLWLGMWFFLPQPVRAYVVAHELTHALWALFSGGRVHSIRVSHKGGSVRLSKSNMLITLAPYFFPFYTIAVILVRLLLSLFLNEVPYPLVWLFFVGLTWGFHITFTIQSLMTTQPDIHEYGRLFSYVIIYLFNLIGVGLWVVCTTSATFGNFSDALIVHAVDVYASVGDEVSSRCHFLYNMAETLSHKLLNYRNSGL
jgi:hypothetical protein